MSQSVLLSKKGMTQAQLATALADPGSAVGQKAAEVASIRRSPQAISGLGDSITYGDASLYQSQYTISTTYFGRLVMKSNGRLRYVQNWGFAGATTQQIIDSKLASCIADDSTLVMVMAGTNDIGAVGYNADTTLTNLTRIWDALLAAGKTPIVGTAPPRTGKVPEVTKLNVRIKHEAAKRNLPVVDLYAVWADPLTGIYQTQYNDGSDGGVHPNAAGAKAGAVAAWAVVQGLIADTPAVLLPSVVNDGANMLTDGIFTGALTSGVAAGWTINGGTTGVTYSVEDHAGWVGKAQVATLNNNTGTVYLSQTLTTGFAVGDRLHCCGRVDGVASGTTYMPYLVFSSGNPGQVRLINGTGLTIDANDWTWAVDCVVPPGTTAVALRLQASAGTGVVKWGQVGLYNLTALGLAA
jgi:lysophospholipase L1-like esterase